jgi:hypothetical protein
MKEDDMKVIDTVMLSPFFINTLMKSGGVIKFKNFPFGVRVVGAELSTPMVELQLFVVPTGVQFKTHADPYQKKQKKNDKVSIEEEESIDL